VIDLHTHSDVSDGSDPPERIPELAAEAGCSAVALTDHDSFAGLDAARRRAGEVGVRLVPGCEVSCRPVVTGGLHVLVYFVDDDGSELGAELERLRADRHVRNLALVDRLVALGAPVTYDQVVGLAGSEAGVGRPHFAAALVAEGLADSIDDAFERYLGNGRPAYSTGLVGAELAQLVAELADAGFGGIEAIYGRYSPRQRQELGNLARRFDLVATGGSDHHGTAKPDLTVGTGRGDLKVPDAVLTRLEERRPGD
jgi:predicted metal-dependent phosphoesterase TrpH